MSYMVIIIIIIKLKNEKHTNEFHIYNHIASNIKNYCKKWVLKDIYKGQEYIHLYKFVS